jgi:hypothetical protein
METRTWYAPGEEGYFMSDEQKDAVIGKVARERAEAKKHLATLRQEADRLGKLLYEMGRQLQFEPEHVVFEREPVNVVYSNPNLNRRPYRKEEIDAASILKLTNEIRATMDNLGILDEKARSMGLD